MTRVRVTCFMCDEGEQKTGNFVSTSGGFSLISSSTHSFNSYTFGVDSAHDGSVSVGLARGVYLQDSLIGSCRGGEQM